MAGKSQGKKSSGRRHLSGREIAFYVLSIIIVLSMTIGFVISMLPGK
jgi:hypothetical protein